MIELGPSYSSLIEIVEGFSSKRLSTKTILYKEFVQELLGKLTDLGELGMTRISRRRASWEICDHPRLGTLQWKYKINPRQTTVTLVVLRNGQRIVSCVL